MVRIGGHLLFALAAIVAWQLLSMVAGESVLAGPVATWRAVVDGVQEGWLLESLTMTLRATALGYLLAAIVGLWAGFVIGSSRFWSDVLEPLFLSVYSIPKVTLFPIFLLLFGLGLESKVAFGMFHGVFPILLFTLNAVRGLPRIYLRVARALNMSAWATFRHVIMPAALPHLVSGLRFGFSLTFLGVVLGEMFASRSGSGHLLVNAVVVQDTPRMLAVIVPLVVIAVGVNAAFLLVEQRVRRRGLDAVPVAPEQKLTAA